MTLKVSIPKSDADDLDDVIRILAIEDSETTPAEAVAELLAEIERLRASNAAMIAGEDFVNLRASHDRLLAAARLATESPYTLYPYSMADVVRDALTAAIAAAEELAP